MKRAPQSSATPIMVSSVAFQHHDQLCDAYYQNEEGEVTPRHFLNDYSDQRSTST
jgi:hypothetical protein